MVKLKLPIDGNTKMHGGIYNGALFNLAVHSGLPLVMSAFGLDVFKKYKFVVGRY